MASESSMDNGVAAKKDMPPTTRHKEPPDTSYSGQIATIEVGTGDDKRTFHAHRELFSLYSAYFKAALNGEFAEAQSSVIKLTTEDPDVFSAFVHWLYTQGP